METEITIHVKYDDLSDECKQKINAYKKQGNKVKIVWPQNVIELSDWPYWTTYRQNLNTTLPNVVDEDKHINNIDVYCKSDETTIVNANSYK